MTASVVQSSAQWIGSLLVQEAGALLDVENLVRGIHEEIELMQQYLQDADARQDYREIRALISQTRKVVYDAEDVIDTYVLKVQYNPKESNWNGLMRFGSFLYNIPHIHQAIKEMRAIQSGLNRITERLNAYGVRRVTPSEGGNGRYSRKQRCCYPYENGEYVVGLEKDIPKLLEILTDDGKNQSNMITIVGMGGSGKTTLARKLYNHTYIRERFNWTAWISISQEWSTPLVIAEILREVGGSELTVGLDKISLPELVKKLRDNLKKKSYLIVLDDVWRTEALEEILPALPLENGHGGGKIIITTRNLEIVQSQHPQLNVYIYEPKPLIEEDGWELFSKIALSHPRNCNTESFKNLGKEMLKKCDGLPLAIVALAGILNKKVNITEWHQVSEAVRYRVMDGAGKVGDMLALSYDDLPYELKPLFLYLGLFPEDCRIPAGMLTRMWIAEGLVTAHTEMTLEDIATQQLEELCNRFMIQIVRTNFKGDIKAVRLHDLMRDLCIKKAKEQSFLQVYTPFCDPGTCDVSVLAIQPRRTALHSSTSLPTGNLHLRSLVLLTRSSISHSDYIDKETLDLRILPRNFKLLRVLNLWGFRTLNGNLPKQIGSLIHLRFLEIRATNITVLPSSIGYLRNLLTLDYRDIDMEDNLTVRIPDVLWKLVLLRHLFLPIECSWNVEELKLSVLPSLQTLWGVKSEGESQWLTREVSKLSASLKKLKVVVSSKSELCAVFSCPSLLSDELQTFDCELRSGVVLDNVEPLCNRQHLHKLILIGKVQMKLPFILPTNLVVLKLKDSLLSDENPMAALGALAHLKRLSVSNAFTGTALVCKPGSFPQLEELCLESLRNVKVLEIERGSMQCLKKLDFIKCWRMVQFPKKLVFVTTLEQLEFFEMPSSFRKNAFEYWWSSQKLRLPHNCGDILKTSDSPIDSSSIRKLFEQLTAGIFLDNKQKKYWVTEQDGSYSNCFMIYASGLNLNRPTLYFDHTNDVAGKEQYRNVVESIDESSVTVGLLDSGSGKVVGRLNTAYLSSGVEYELHWVFMFKSPQFLSPFPNPAPARLHAKLTLPFFCTNVLATSLSSEPPKYWFRVPGGVFETTKYPETEEIEFSLRFLVGSKFTQLLIKGIVIEPIKKNICPSSTSTTTTTTIIPWTKEKPLLDGQDPHKIFWFDKYIN